MNADDKKYNKFTFVTGRITSFSSGCVTHCDCILSIQLFSK